jgi:hypothetical protein
MKDWQFYLAILILIILINIKVKENLDTDIPARATAYDKPSDIIKKTQSILNEEPNYDKNQYINTKTSSDILEKNRDIAYSTNIREGSILDKCNEALDVILEEIKVIKKETDDTNELEKKKRDQLENEKKSLHQRTIDVNNIINEINGKRTHINNLNNNINWYNSNTNSNNNTNYYFNENNYNNSSVSGVVGWLNF